MTDWITVAPKKHTEKLPRNYSDSTTHSHLILFDGCNHDFFGLGFSKFDGIWLEGEDLGANFSLDVTITIGKKEFGDPNLKGSLKNRDLKILQRLVLIHPHEDLRKKIVSRLYVEFLWTTRLLQCFALDPAHYRRRLYDGLNHCSSKKTHRKATQEL